MSALRLAGNELRRITAGRLPRLAVLALVLVPLLYGSLYLFANHDPYGRLDHIPAALVMQDEGDYGGKVADQLQESGAFHWHRVDAQDADTGVRDGTYSFSMTIPKDFTAALDSSGAFQPRQGLITVTTNDANNYLVGTIADKVASEVRQSITSEVGQTAADRFLIGFGTIFTRTQEAANGAGQLADATVQARDGAARLDAGQRKLADGAAQLSTGLKQLSGGLNTLHDKTKDLPANARKLADGAAQVAAGNAQVAAQGQHIADVSTQLVGGLDQLNGDIAAKLRAAGFTEDQIQRVTTALSQTRQPIDDANTKVQTAATQLTKLAAGAKHVSDGAAQLAAQAPALADGISEAAAGGTKLNAGAAELAGGEKTAVDGTAKLADGTKQIADGSTKLRDGLNQGLGQIPHPDDPTRNATAHTIGNPVSINTVGDVKAGSYGAGLAPFFFGLATWIGAFVLFLLIKPLSSRAVAAGQPAWRVALGGWLPAAGLGLAQVVLLFTVVTTLVGIDAHRPLAAFGLLALASLSFTAILHALNAFFGAVGKFLGLVLLILQLISSGGTFPWQTLPDVLYPLHSVLPMGYVVDGMRHLLYGGSMVSVGEDVLVLVAYLAGALLVSTLAARRRRVWTPSRLKPELVL
ncbi:YhgE/Pip domain-containing protein [Kibdelosporangium persicum]|uniref:ESX secretion system protein YueB n=1 Tax=Kibdelosporangium persicum TaxID=2698649 RepID=A0ABX2F2L3_9PSEU|nr:YhgE/Pip domain-containing protein [Kibdelosporangium persicum]NRN65573.1 ESX secretion system protein YueB [Kibdelosporangium persicum]